MLRGLAMTLAAIAALGATAGSVTAGVDRARPGCGVGSSAFGRVRFDARGFVLYGFTRDPRGKSVCTGDCAKAWPPYIVKSRLRAGPGVDAARLGTVKRADDSLQATYAGR